MIHIYIPKSLESSTAQNQSIWKWLKRSSNGSKRTPIRYLYKLIKKTDMIETLLFPRKKNLTSATICVGLRLRFWNNCCKIQNVLTIPSSLSQFSVHWILWNYFQNVYELYCAPCFKKRSFITHFKILQKKY